MMLRPDSSMQTRLEAIAAAALQATAAAGATIILETEGSFSIACHVGAEREGCRATKALHQIALRERIIFATSRDAERSIAGAVQESGHSFFASANFESNGLNGYLCVFANESRSLSGAQEYVLQVFAANIADQIALAALQSNAREGTERLRLLESVVVKANDAVLITAAEPVDAPGPCIVYANPAFTRTTGYELGEIIGKTPRILQGPATSRSSREKLRSALIAWKPIEVELLNYKKDGTSFLVELSIVPVADESGRWTHWVSVQRDVTERKTVEEIDVRGRIADAERAALLNRIFHDELTGLRNRAYFMDRLRGAMSEASAERIAVLFMDVDRFKVVNDSLGHDVGDQLLVEIARRLRRCVRVPDVLARMGGDEFTFFIEDTQDLRGSKALAERVLHELSAPIHVGGHEIVAGASVGICSIDPRESSPENALRNADIAMYHAKALGGRRFAIFDPTMHERAISTMQTEEELRAALAGNEFELFYQPLVSLSDGDIYGFEALVRWNHPVRGLVPPVEFIPLAEDTGLILPLGSWILRDACRQLREWEEAGLRGLIIHVNLSGRQLFDKNFRDELIQAHSMLGQLVAQVQLEITESILLGRASLAHDLLQWARSLGFRVAFDDFGTGFSSLSYLQRFQIDTLKIDASFISKMDEQAGSIEIVRMIVALGNALAIEVVAEGIETENQRALLMECKAEFGQGYFFGKPVPKDRVPELLGNASSDSTSRALSTTIRN